MHDIADTVGLQDCILTELFLRSPSFVAVLRGSDHTIEAVNPAFVELVGSLPVLGLPLCEALPELALQHLTAELDDVRTARRSFTTSERELCIFRDGGKHTVFVDMTCTPLPGLHDEDMGVLVQGTDCTERVRTREELSRMAAEREAILRSIGDGVVVIDSRGTATFVNEAAALMSGTKTGTAFDRAELPFRAVRADGTVYSRCDLPLARSLMTGEHIRGEGAWVHGPDGVDRWIEVTASPVVTCAGERIGAVLISRDETERKHVQEQLRDNEQRFRQLTENSRQVFWMVDVASGELIYLSPAFEEVWGLSRDGLLGHYSTVMEFVHPDDREKVFRTYEPMLRGETTDTEYSIVRPDGEERTLRDRGFPVRDAQGRIYRIAGVTDDVTVMTRTMRDLAVAQARAQALLDALPDPAWMKDADGRFVAVNSAMLRDCGLDVTREQMIGARDEELFSGPNARLYAEHDRAVLQLGSPIRLTQSIPIRDEVRWVETWKAPISHDVLGSSGTAGIARDITEQKRVENELRLATARLESVLNTSPLPIVALDEQLTVLLWNRAAEQLFGWSAAEVLGQPYPLKGTGDPRHSTENLCGGGFRGEFSNGLEIQRVVRDGRTIDLHLWTAPLHGPDGSTEAIVAVMADLSDRKRLEEQFRQAQKMEAVGRLAGGVAHDFNNILTVIGGHASLLLESLHEPDPLREDLLEISQSVERAVGLTRQLLAFSRKQVLQPRVLDAARLIEDSRRMLHRLIGEDVELNVITDPAWSVRADPGQLEQVLLNLVVNARDAMPNGGRLTIALRNSEVRDDPDLPDGDFVRLSVTDTGVGITPDDMEHIFEPFFTSKPAGKGTGLGLSTVYGIVSQSGGHVRVQSTPGSGTTFLIYLPRVDEQPEQTAPAPSREARDGSETVLLIEDEDAVRTLMERALRRKGYRVLPAANAGEAMLLARRGERIDLVVSDVIMPQMSGPEVAGYLEEILPGVRFLFVSGYTQEMMTDRGLDAGTLNFLQKPFDPAELVRKVRDTLDA